MRLSTRLIIAVYFGLALAVFAYAPVLLGHDQGRVMQLAVWAQLGGPLAAAVSCLLAAWRSRQSERAAWLNFGIGSLLYLAGNLGYAYFSLIGVSPSFPAAPELAYFTMGLFFAIGMFQYAKVRNRLSRVQLYNFVLIYCAVTLGSLFTLSHSLAVSVLSPFGTIAAFLYPALWFSVASTGLISLLLYDQGKKSFPMSLLLLAVLSESIADYSYALQLMDGSYHLGGMSQLLWVASAGLITWAALEHIALTRGAVSEPKETRRRTDRGIAQAAVPAVAVATILLAGSFTGALGSGAYVWLSAVLGVGFAIIAGFREHWIIHTQRKLRSVVEDSRADLEKSQERIRSVLESTSDSVLVLDHDWTVVYYNQRAIETIKQPDRLRIGISVWELFPAAATTGEGEHYRRAVETRQPAEFEVFVPDRKVWLGINAYPTQDGLSIFFRDISEQRRVREEMTHMAHHDPLTGLGNRLRFQETLEQAIGSGQSVATLVLDLDHFKEVNDTLGHPVGDAVLVETARRLRACVRPQDTIARLGGDEFAVIVTGYSGRTELLRLTQGLIEAAVQPHHIEGLTVHVGASAGIALSVPGKDDANQLFKNADIALYIAKSEARGSYCFFEPAMQVGMQQRQALRTDLAAALDRKQFELAFQPLVDLRTGRVSSFETLLRWRHPDLGMVAPDVFIPLAEDSGLMIGIGDWVLRQACIEAQNWPEEISLAVNLSTKQFGDDGLADRIAATLEFTGLAHERLELEITESVLLKDNKTNLLTLNRLRNMGIRIALDDFGTGYSSLGYLQRFPFSKIKIDRSFISGLPESDESQAIVRSVIGLGKALGMKVTAEGVETAEQLDWVTNGCDEAQGYFLSRPVPAPDVLDLTARINGDAGQRRAG